MGKLGPAEPTADDLHTNLKDLDRQAEFEGEHRHRARPGHVLRDVRLQASGGSGAKEWRVVHLHTQDIRFLSGVSVWRGTDYGFWFERTD